MMMKAIIAWSLLSLSVVAHEYDATRFMCESRGQSFELLLNKDTKAVEHFYYLGQGPTMWLANTINVENRDFSIGVFRPESVAPGHLSSQGMIQQISFRLPRAKVSTYQSGGYYIPEWTTVPAQFSLTITETYPDKKEQTVSLSCVGY